MSLRCLFDVTGAQAPGTIRTLAGLYLELNLHQLAADGELLIYANYIASLDGRIALWNAARQDFEVPASLANARDWRLYQELAAQSDIMLTSARYFRQLAGGRAQDLLPVATGDAYADIRCWRQAQGLSPQPDVAVLSHSLEIPAQALDRLRDRRLLVLTDEQADDKRVAALERQGVVVLACGHERVEGRSLKQALIRQGYRSAYMIAGPAVLHTLLVGGCLDLLFLTTRHRLLGGRRMHTLLDAGLETMPGGAADLQLQALYLDEADQPGQLFARYALAAQGRD